ncbi:hypothetical protein [Streptomyces camelliae]|uniref:PPM-type phosphatase domain-containing protein n=1 Tax=Streptomyces camelliae TaxID=3004093 RepID=A0ABY7PH17_9ACTN|nr:hypothetical protein [Streptomyces sp. HUAS 2-6]WBO68845.1 hypothetical protein O1G22_41660 [Streptomyces sp. HUAS 2-6]
MLLRMPAGEQSVAGASISDVGVWPTGRGELLDQLAEPFGKVERLASQEQVKSCPVADDLIDSDLRDGGYRLGDEHCQKAGDAMVEGERRVAEQCLRVGDALVVVQRC